MRSLRDVTLQDVTVGVFETFGVIESKDEVVAGSESSRAGIPSWAVLVAGRIPIRDGSRRLGEALRNGEIVACAEKRSGAFTVPAIDALSFRQHDVQSPAAERPLSSTSSSVSRLVWPYSAEATYQDSRERR